jgi:hypothetical protein
MGIIVLIFFFPFFPRKVLRFLSNITYIGRKHYRQSTSGYNSLVFPKYNGDSRSRNHSLSCQSRNDCSLVSDRTFVLKNSGLFLIKKSTQLPIQLAFNYIGMESLGLLFEHLKTAKTARSNNSFSDLFTLRGMLF